MVRVWYPSIEDIIDYNKKMVKMYSATKSEKHEMGGESKKRIKKAIESSRSKKGDVEDKALVLLKKLNILHPFGSANRRTAHFAMNKMLYCNRDYLLAMKREKQTNIQKRIRNRELCSHKKIRKEYGL